MVVYPNAMSIPDKSVRQSVSLPARVARRVKSLAQTSKTSTSRVIADLIETGLDAREQEKKRFFECADRLARARDPEEHERAEQNAANHPDSLACERRLYARREASASSRFGRGRG